MQYMTIYYDNTKLLRSKLVSDNSEMKVYNTLSRPVVTLQVRHGQCKKGGTTNTKDVWKTDCTYLGLVKESMNKE